MRYLIGILLLLHFDLYTASAQEGDLTFKTVELTIDTKGQPLAAWQLEVKYSKGRTEITGIEGGDLPSKTPPAYDARGLSEGRLILAQFTTAKEKLPGGKIKLARLHLATREDTPDLELRLMAAATPDGARIRARPDFHFMAGKEGP